jgi:hypothetical protein
MEREDLYAISLSSGFRAWLQRFGGGKLGVGLNISISESLSRYPLPAERISPKGIDAANRFNDLVVVFAAVHTCGLTDVMNAINNPSIGDAEILELRQLLSIIDSDVVAAYGWDDLEIAYDFQEISGGSVNDPLRWALSEDVTADLLGRLTALNRERFEAAVSSSGASMVRKSKRGRRQKADSSMPLDDLFARNNA